MLINFSIWIAGNPRRADYGLSKNTTDDEIGPYIVTPFALLRASSEPIRYTQGKLREGSVVLGSEMLRCSMRCAQDKAQHDSAVIHTDDLIMLLICIIFSPEMRLISPGPPRLHATLQ